MESFGPQGHVSKEASNENLFNMKVVFSPFQKVQELENPMYGWKIMAQWISEMTHNQEAIISTWFVQIASSSRIVAMSFCEPRRSSKNMGS